MAEVLGYSDTFGALKKHVDDEDKQNCQNDSFESNRGLTVINESGLYSLILSSKLPKAKELKRLYLREYRSKSDRQERTVEEHSKHDSGLCFVQSFLILINCTHNIFFLLLVSLWRFEGVRGELNPKAILSVHCTDKISACDLRRRSIFLWYRSQIMRIIFFKKVNKKNPCYYEQQGFYSIISC